MSTKLFDLTGRIAVITGTSRGIGRELALGFAEAGAIVVGCARSFEAAEHTAAEIRSNGHDTLAVLADVTKPEDCEALVQAAVRRYGKLDIMLCNAAETIRKPAIDFTPEEFGKVIDSTLNGYFHCAQAAARQFIRQGTGGSIVMNSSNASVAAFDGYAPYCAGKGGVDMLVRSLAPEWGPHKIRVNAFNPGYTYVDGTPQSISGNEEKQTILSRTPLKRIAHIREMVGPAIFLASDAASYVTGAILLVDGGWCAL